MELHQRLWRECARLQCVDRQSRDLETARARCLRTAEAAPAIEQVRQRLERKGIGPNSAGLLVQACCAWRQLANRRQRGAWAGESRPQGEGRAGSTEPGQATHPGPVGSA